MNHKAIINYELKAHDILLYFAQSPISRTQVSPVLRKCTKWAFIYAEKESLGTYRK
jgi:hypothetical protein